MSDRPRRRRVGPAEQQYGRPSGAQAGDRTGRLRPTLPPAWVTALVLLVLAGLLVLLAVLV